MAHRGAGRISTVRAIVGENSESHTVGTNSVQGKGTQAQFIKDSGIPQISTGDMLRLPVCSELGNRGCSHDSGALVSDDIIIDLAKSEQPMTVPTAFLTVSREPFLKRRPWMTRESLLMQENSGSRRRTGKAHYLRRCIRDRVGFITLSTTHRSRKGQMM